MKLKKLFAGFIAGAMALTSLATGAAADLTFTGSNGTSTYALNLTAVIEFATTKFDTTQFISVPGDYIEGGSINVTDGTKTNSAKLTNVKLNGAKLTSTVVNFGLQKGENKLPANSYSTFTWTATATFSDASKNPVADLGYVLADFANKNSIALKIKVDKYTLDTSSSKAELVTTSGAANTISSGSIVKVSALNEGKGMKLSDKAGLKALAGKNVTVTVLLPAAAEDATMLRFRTNLTASTDDGILGYANKGATSIVFNSIPSSYFYAYTAADAYSLGGETYFDNMTVLTTYGKATSYSGIIITVPAATADTTPPATDPVTPPAEDSTLDDTEDVSEEEFVLNASAITLNKGATFVLKSNYEDVKWSTSKKATCKVYTSGKIKAMAKGTAYIYCKNTDGEKIKCKVTVIDSATPATSIAMKTTSGTGYVGKSYSLKTTVTPAATTDVITWSSNDTSVATVSSTGKVKCVSAGTVVITATTSSGLSANCQLTIKNPSIKLATSKATLSVGGTTKISATIKPTSAKPEYESLNEAVATVDASGNVTAIAAGTAKITVTASGIVKTFTVTVA